MSKPAVMSYCRVKWSAHELLAMCCAMTPQPSKCLWSMHVPIYTPLLPASLSLIVPNRSSPFFARSFAKALAVPPMGRCMQIDWCLVNKVIKYAQHILTIIFHPISPLHSCQSFPRADFTHEHESIMVGAPCDQWSWNGWHSGIRYGKARAFHYRLSLGGCDDARMDQKCRSMSMHLAACQPSPSMPPMRRPCSLQQRSTERVR